VTRLHGSVCETSTTDGRDTGGRLLVDGLVVEPAVVVDGAALVDVESLEDG
jgi:hypothetical protein